MTDYSHVSREDLISRSKIPIEVVDTEDDIYHDMARVMLEEIKKNNASDKPTVLIVPVGPVYQYRRFVRLVNREKLNLKRLYIIGMDEYMVDRQNMVDITHPLSFRGFMDRELYDCLEPDLTVPPENRFFPEPGNESKIEGIIQQLGGVDIAMGGIGICGHIAFNEPPEPDECITDAQFSDLPTRVLKLSRETLTINSVTAMGGYIDGIPKYCVTVGMREILSARKIRFYLNREWQRGIVRKICLGGVTASVPASFFQQHPDALLTIASYVAEPPVGALR